MNGAFRGASGGRGLPDPQWATAAAVGPGAVREAWGGGLPGPQWATVAAVGPGAVRRESY